MRWKRFLAIGVLTIVILIAAVSVYLSTYDYKSLKPHVAQLVKDVTGREFRLGGEINLAIGFSPSLVVTDVALANVSWGSQPQMIKVEKLQAQVRLLPLLFKDVELKRIGLAGVDVLLETEPNGQGNWDFTGGDKSGKSLEAFEPIKLDIDSIRIENLRLAFRKGKTGSAKRFTLASLDVARQGTDDALMLNLRADYNGQPVELTGTTGLIRHLFAHQRFPLTLSGKFSNTDVKIDGAIDDILNLQGIDLKAHASGTDLAALGLDKNIRLPQTSVFDITGLLKGSKESLALNDVSGSLSASGVKLAFSGNVGNLIALSGIDLKLNGSGKDLSAVGPIIGEKLPATDQFEIQGRMTGSTKVLTLKEAQGSARRGSMSFTVNGSIKDLPTLKGMALNASLKGKNLQKFGEIIGEKLPATDEFTIEGHLTGSAKALSLKNVQGSGKQGSLSVALNGDVRDLIAVSGLDLQIKGAGKSLMEIGKIIDIVLYVMGWR